MISTKCDGKIIEGAINSDGERIGIWWIWAECDREWKEGPPKQRSPPLTKAERWERLGPSGLLHLYGLALV